MANLTGSWPAGPGFLGGGPRSQAPPLPLALPQLAQADVRARVRRPSTQGRAGGAAGFARWQLMLGPVVARGKMPRAGRAVGPCRAGRGVHCHVARALAGDPQAEAARFAVRTAPWLGRPRHSPCE